LTSENTRDNVSANDIKLEVDMASMKDVARLSDVSISTVSRVISGTIPVDRVTRRRVERAIESTGYKPNLIARGLRVKSTNLVGMLVPEIRTTSFATLIEYVEECAEALGYNLILGGTGGDPEREERFFENLIRRHIDGIIISLVSDRSRLIQIIDRTEVPVVIVDRPLDNHDLPTVVLDNYEAGVMAAGHLLSLGHERYACITGDRDISIARERTDGFRDSLKAAGKYFAEQNIVEGHFDYDSGRNGVDILLDRGADFTALWAQNDLMAIGALNRLRERGISVPGDVSVMGLDNVEDSWMARPALTTVAQPYRKIADSAVRLLLNLSKNIEVEDRRVYHQPELVIRDSTGPVKG